MSRVRPQRLLACAALVLASCSTETEPLTQIVVVVDSDFSGLTRFEADIEGFEEPETVSADLEDEPLPRRFSMVHDGGPLGPMAVTVRAYIDDGDEPILVEPRTGMFFEPGRTLLLKVDLLQACVGLCEEGQACIAPGECVSSDEAAELIPWTGPPDGLGVGGPFDGGMDGGPPFMPDGSVRDAEDEPDDAEPTDRDADDPEDADVELDASPDADATVDAAPDADVPDPTWPFTPGNVDVDDDILADLERLDVVLDCGGTAIIDSSDPPSATGFCDQAPELAVIEQASGGEVLAVVMSSLAIDASSTLKLVGSRPVVLLVEGDASIAGAIDASADGETAGAGGSDAEVCAGSSGSTGSPGGTSGSISLGAGGGSGGGFGSAGSSSGASGSGMTVPSVPGGAAAAAEPTLSPLRGGCPGGAGGAKTPGSNAGGGAGGGAVQLSVSGQLALSGVIHAGGGGGAAGMGSLGGGGGGGSGGAILIEAETIAVEAGAIVAANGGAGGGGQPMSSLTSTPGADGEPGTAVAMGGNGASTGGDGGFGASLAGAATGGGGGSSGGTCFPISAGCHYGGGGGGAGGVGRIRIRGVNSCAPLGTFSPWPSVACEACGDCPAQPDLTCVARAAAAAVYSVCATEVSWDAARALCQGAGLDLVKVDDPAENAYLTTQIADETWLGASDAVEDDWRWVLDNSQFWSGDEQDGDPVGGAFNAWEVGDEPNGSGDCARMLTSGEWADQDCSDPLPFICEKP